MNKNFYILTFKVKPNKLKTKIIKNENDVYWIDIAAPPIDNEANEELIAFVSKEFDISKSRIEFLSGKRARIKRLKIYK